MRTTSGVRAVLIALSGVVAASCTTVPEPTAPTPPPVAKVTPPPPPPAVAKAKPRVASPYKSMEQYKLALAKRIFETSSGKTVNGDLQPLLRAVVVLQFNVDSSGNVRNVRTLRSPEKEADQIARASLERAGTMPVPPEEWLQNGVVEVTETWLFNKDGRFHLRTFGPRQRGA
jgi:periplasmic protein TonB